MLPDDVIRRQRREELKIMKPWDNGIKSILISLGFYNKIPSTVWLKQQTFSFSQFWGWKAKVGAGMVRFWWEFSWRLLSSSCVCKVVEKEGEEKWGEGRKRERESERERDLLYSWISFEALFRGQSFPFLEQLINSTPNHFSYRDPHALG